jgi:hypothetical protein
MSATCNSFKSTVCTTGLQTIDNTCSCLNYQLSPPFVSGNALSMKGDFGAYVAGAQLPITPIAQSLIRERSALVAGDGQLLAAQTQQLQCGFNERPCARTKSCVPVNSPNTMWPAAPYNN